MTASTAAHAKQPSREVLDTTFHHTPALLLHADPEALGSFHPNVKLPSGNGATIDVDLVMRNAAIDSSGVDPLIAPPRRLLDQELVPLCTQQLLETVAAMRGAVESGCVPDSELRAEIMQRDTFGDLGDRLAMLWTATDQCREPYKKVQATAERRPFQRDELARELELFLAHTETLFEPWDTLPTYTDALLRAVSNPAVADHTLQRGVADLARSIRTLPTDCAPACSNFSRLRQLCAQDPLDRHALVRLLIAMKLELRMLPEDDHRMKTIDDLLELAGLHEDFVGFSIAIESGLAASLRELRIAAVCAAQQHELNVHGSDQERRDAAFLYQTAKAAMEEMLELEADYESALTTFIARLPKAERALMNEAGKRISSLYDVLGSLADERVQSMPEEPAVAAKRERDEQYAEVQYAVRQLKLQTLALNLPSMLSSFEKRIHASRLAALMSDPPVADLPSLAAARFDALEREISRYTAHPLRFVLQNGSARMPDKLGAELIDQGVLDEQWTEEQMLETLAPLEQPLRELFGYYAQLLSWNEAFVRRRGFIPGAS